MGTTHTAARTSKISPVCIHHIAINVKDLQRSIDFYKELLGFRLLDRDEHSAKLSIGNSDIVLFQLPSDINITPTARDTQSTSLNHIAFEIHPSLFERYHQLLLDNDVQITFGPVKRRHGYALYFLDPDGNKIEFFFNNTFSNRH